MVPNIQKVPCNISPEISVRYQEMSCPNIRTVPRNKVSKYSQNVEADGVKSPNSTRTCVAKMSVEERGILCQSILAAPRNILPKYP